MHVFVNASCLSLFISLSHSPKVGDANVLAKTTKKSNSLLSQHAHKFKLGTSNACSIIVMIVPSLTKETPNIIKEGIIATGNNTQHISAE